MRTDLNVLFDGEVFKNTPAFDHLNDARPGNFFGGFAVDAIAQELDRTIGDATILVLKQTRDRLERRAFARTIRAKQGNDPAVRHAERNTFEHEDDFVVHHFDVVEIENVAVVHCNSQGSVDNIHNKTRTLHFAFTIRFPHQDIAFANYCECYLVVRNPKSGD